MQQESTARRGPLGGAVRGRISARRAGHHAHSTRANMRTHAEADCARGERRRPAPSAVRDARGALVDAARPSAVVDGEDLNGGRADRPDSTCLLGVEREGEGGAERGMLFVGQVRQGCAQGPSRSRWRWASVPRRAENDSFAAAQGRAGSNTGRGDLNGCWNLRHTSLAQ